MKVWTQHIVQSLASLNFRKLFFRPDSQNLLMSHCESFDGFNCTKISDRQGDTEDGALDWLLIGSDRDGVVIGCSLQVVDPFPAHLCRRSRRWILRRILDALCDRLSDLLPWKNGLPVFTSDGCL